MTSFSLCSRLASSAVNSESKKTSLATAKALPLPLDEMVSVQFYDGIDPISSRWLDIISHDTFLCPPFLKALENAPPSDSKFRYAIFSTEEDGEIGVGYFQIKTIRLDESLRFHTDENSLTTTKILNSIKRSVASRFRAYTLVVGNLALTGNYGMYFHEDISIERRFSLIDQSINLLLPILAKQGIKVRGIMYKDFESTHRMPSKHGYSEFSVQPQMTMHLDPKWTSSQDYIDAMKSKYKVRMRRARTKSEGILKRELSANEVKSYESEIVRLYRYVSDQADFNLFILKDNYFHSLLEHLGSAMKLIAYFLDGKMVGFYTSINCGKTLDAHFLGYDNTYNAEHQLYLNMLYDLVEDGIALGVEHVDLSRTALEIKSSVGAVPKDLYLYLKLTNKSLDKYTPKLLEFMTPKEEWIPRNPFK